MKYIVRIENWYSFTTEFGEKYKWNSGDNLKDFNPFDDSYNRSILIFMNEDDGWVKYAEDFNEAEYDYYYPNGGVPKLKPTNNITPEPKEQHLKEFFYGSGYDDMIMNYARDNGVRALSVTSLQTSYGTHLLVLFEKL